jgi:hypothetical protein
MARFALGREVRQVRQSTQVFVGAGARSAGSRRLAAEHRRQRSHPEPASRPRKKLTPRLAEYGVFGRESFVQGFVQTENLVCHHRERREFRRRKVAVGRRLTHCQ